MFVSNIKSLQTSPSSSWRYRPGIPHPSRPNPSLTNDFPTPAHLHSQLLLMSNYPQYIYIYIYTHRTDVLKTICHLQPSGLISCSGYFLIYNRNHSFFLLTITVSGSPALPPENQPYDSESSSCLPPTTSPPGWPFNSEPWRPPSWRVSCLLVRAIMTVIMDVRRHRQTGIMNVRRQRRIYYEAMRIKGEGQGMMRSSMH